MISPNAALPTPQQVRQQQRSTMLQKMFECSICLQQLPKTYHIISSCGHFYCYPCIGRHILERTAEWSKCPKCRQLLPAKDRRAIVEKIAIYNARGELQSPPYNKARTSYLSSHYYLTDLERETFRDKLTLDSHILDPSSADEADIYAIHPEHGSFLFQAWQNSDGTDSHLQIIKRMINFRKIDLDHPCITSGEPLLVCVLWNFNHDPFSYRTIETLLEHHASPNGRTKSPPHTPYIHIAASQSPEAVKLLADYGARINVHDDDHRNPLFDCREPDVAEVLLGLSEKLDMNDTDAFGYSPLSFSARFGHKKMLVYWIKRGADKQCKDIRGDCDLLSFLINCISASRFHFNSDGIRGSINTLLEMEDWSCVYNWQQAFKEIFKTRESCKNEYLLKILAKMIESAKSADLDVAKCIDDNKLLHKAIMADGHNACELLLKTNADINLIDENGFDCIELAIECDQDRILHLISHYRDIINNC